MKLNILVFTLFTLIIASACREKDVDIKNKGPLELMQSDLQHVSNKINVKINIGEELHYDYVTIYLREMHDSITINTLKYGDIRHLTIYNANRHIKFEDFENLNSITLMNYSDSILPSLKYLKNLYSFNCQCPHLQGSFDLAHLNDRISNVTLSQTKINHITISNPENFRRLHSLDLSNNEHLAFIDSAMYELYMLKWLRANNTKLNTESIDFSKFQRLECIFLNKNAVLSREQLKQVKEKEIEIHQ